MRICFILHSEKLTWQMFPKNVKFVSIVTLETKLSSSNGIHVFVNNHVNDNRYSH